VEPVAHAFGEAKLSGPQPFFTQLPPPAIGFGYAAAFLQAHHVVQLVRFEPSNEAGSMKAAIGKDYGTDPPRESSNERQKGILFELVLALGRWQVVPVVSQLQKWQRPSLTRDGDAQNLG
jgi:hypothetical protein